MGLAPGHPFLKMATKHGFDLKATGDPKKDANFIMHALDKDGDGHITFKEFMTHVEKLRKGSAADDTFEGFMEC